MVVSGLLFFFDLKNRYRVNLFFITNILKNYSHNPTLKLDVNLISYGWWIFVRQRNLVTNMVPILFHSPARVQCVMLSCACVGDSCRNIQTATEYSLHGPVGQVYTLEATGKDMVFAVWKWLRNRLQKLIWAVIKLCTDDDIFLGTELEL